MRECESEARREKLLTNSDEAVQDPKRALSRNREIENKRAEEMANALNDTRTARGLFSFPSALVDSYTWQLEISISGPGFRVSRSVRSALKPSSFWLKRAKF